MSPTNKSYVSIQLPLGGHSFSSNSLRGINAGKHSDIHAIVDTAKCAVVPVEYFDSHNAEGMLRATGVIVDGDEVVVHSQHDTMVAIMAMSRACYDMLTKEYGEQITFTTPLLTSPMPEHGSVIHLGTNAIYVRVANDGLRLIEAMEVASDADILYMFESINKVYNIYNMYARAEGDTQRLMKLCKRSFKNIVCE